MKELIASLLLQASQLSGLPWDGSIPHVRQVHECTLIREFTSQPLSNAQCQIMIHEDVPRPQAYYLNRIITLQNTFDATNVHKRSILVHELVHYLQHINGVRPTGSCRKQLEVLAYNTQAKWLVQHGQITLAQEERLRGQRFSQC